MNKTIYAYIYALLEKEKYVCYKSITIFNYGCGFMQYTPENMSKIFYLSCN